MAELQLKKPICFFDIESTGVNVVKDRIVEISILKVFPNGNKESRTWLVNPEMEIPEEVVAIHGISNEKVANEPTFKELAHRVHDMIKDADLAGYNSNKFDIPLLAEEFLRAEIDFDFSKKRAVDVQNIFHKKEQRTLEAAYRFYCDKTLENAHSAEANSPRCSDSPIYSGPNTAKGRMGILAVRMYTGLGDCQVTVRSIP